MVVTPNQYYIQAKLRIIKKEVVSSKSKTDLAIKIFLNFLLDNHSREISHE